MVLIEPGAIATPIWDRGIAAADTLYAAMPPAAHERYGRLVDTMRSLAIGQAQERRPARGRRADHRHGAHDADSPRTRYVVGDERRIQAVLSRVLPGRALDKVLTECSRT